MKPNLVQDVFNTFSNNLFGIVAGGNGIARNSSGAGFIPLDGNGNTMMLKDTHASWLGLRSRQMQKYAYEFCYPLATVVDRLAEYDLTGKLQISRLKGKGADDLATSPWATRMNKLFARPNALQSWEQFRGQQIVYKKIFGFCPVFPIIPAGFEDDLSNATAMINLPPWLFEPVATNKLLYQTKLEDIVDHYNVTILGRSFQLKPSQVFILEDGFFQDEERQFLLPLSKLVGLDMAISNINYAMEADNVLLRKRGPLGFISHDAAATKDAVAGYLPMTQGETDELQQALSKYGMSWAQYQWVISRQAVKWNPTSFDVKQLGTKETVVAGEKAICHRYGFPYPLYEESDATYSISSNAPVNCYQNNIIPNARRDMNVYNQWFGAVDNNAVIEIDFDHLAVLQEDALNREHATFFQSQSLAIQYTNGIITLNEWRQAQGMGIISGGDVYKEQPPVNSAPTNPIDPNEKDTAPKS